LADPRAPIDPQVQALFDMFNAGKDARVLEPGPMREGLGALAPLLIAGAPAVHSEKEIQIPGPAGKLRARVFYPGDPARGPYPVIVYIHGGGYVVMSIETHEKLTKQLCVGVGAIVVSIDYRLAPEHRYPAPLDDCVAAFRWVRAHAAELGGDPARVAAAGDSAGGNAAAAVALRLIAAKEAPPTALVLLCPWTDMALDTDSFRKYGPGDAVLDTDIMTWFRDCYVKPGDWSDPFASPLRGDVSKFPPTLVVVGGIDPLGDDGLLFAEKLEKAGRKVVLSSHPGMPHDFMVFPGIDEGARAIDGICRFAKSALGS
jgi:acetyl esterase